MKRLIGLTLLLLATACGSSASKNELDAELAESAYRVHPGPVTERVEPPPFGAFVSTICPAFIDETEEAASRVLSAARAQGAAQPSTVVCLRGRVGQTVTCAANGNTTQLAAVGVMFVGCGDNTAYAVDVVP
jgi:hypothetical protein